MVAFAPSSNARQSAIRGAIATALCVIAVIVYCVALHLLITGGTLPRVALALALTPFVVALGSLSAKRRPHRATRRAVLAAALAAALGLGFIVWRFGDILASRVDRVVYLENLAFNLFLALMFAITLRPGREALITRLARGLRGENMPDAIVSYTRRLTAVWSLYFIAVAATSTMLFLTQSREVWSLFVNVLIWPLTLSMFVIEYAVRLRVLRDHGHATLLATMRAFMHRAS